MCSYDLLEFKNNSLTVEWRFGHLDGFQWSVGASDIICQLSELGLTRIKFDSSQRKVVMQSEVLTEFLVCCSGAWRASAISGFHKKLTGNPLGFFQLKSHLSSKLNSPSTILQSIQMPAEVAAAESGGHRGNLRNLWPPLQQISPENQLSSTCSVLSGNMLSTNKLALTLPLPPLAPTQQLLLILWLDHVNSSLASILAFLEEVAEEVAEVHSDLPGQFMTTPGHFPLTTYCARCINMIRMMVHTPSTAHQLLEYRGGSGVPATQFG
ncbi:hypothetical protein B0H13DRAFT_1893789 [Mycena leptocephala]|nr:hypothetical protein B0H13DRAFT_1893789 [Mycena leptocephala]